MALLVAATYSPQSGGKVEITYDSVTLAMLQVVPSDLSADVAVTITQPGVTCPTKYDGVVRADAVDLPAGLVFGAGLSGFAFTFQDA